MKIAFLTTRRDKPSYRFRVEQFLPHLRGGGFECDTLFLPRSAVSRWRLLCSLSGYDIVFLQKKLLGFVGRRLLRAAARKLVYDVDDAVMLREEGLNSERAARGERRFRATARMCDLVLAGNDFLCRAAADCARWVVCHRTVVDTERYAPAEPRESEAPVIGWSGSRSTNRYLNIVLPVIARLAESRRLALRIVSDTKEGIDFPLCGTAAVEFSRWDSATEAADIRKFDIGLMPLPDSEWARGKCSLKALLYMASGVPAVCSPVGEVTGIISDGENGFLAASGEEWSRKLKALSTDHALRRRIAERGRETVERRFSVSALAPRLAGLFRELAGEAQSP